MPQVNLMSAETETHPSMPRHLPNRPKYIEPARPWKRYSERMNEWRVDERKAGPLWTPRMWGSDITPMSCAHRILELTRILNPHTGSAS